MRKIKWRESTLLVVRWPECVFISEGNPHFTSWFCRVELDPTLNYSKTICPYQIQVIKLNEK
jgi:hypothetical protein